jgi:hypothetical protein
MAESDRLKKSVALVEESVDSISNDVLLAI